MDDEDDGPDSRAPTIEDLAEICDALNRSEARYLLIGGFAVIAHGAGRTTKDIDFLIDPIGTVSQDVPHHEWEPRAPIPRSKVYELLLPPYGIAPLE